MAINKNLKKNVKLELSSYSEFLILFAHNARMIILIPLILTFIMFIYLQFFAEPVFTSYSKIISSSRSEGAQAIGLAAQFGINLSDNSSEPDWAYPDIIKSRLLTKSLLERTFKIKNSNNQQKLLNIILAKEKNLDLGKDTLVMIASEKLLECIRVDENVKTGVITISVDFFDPRLASEINKAIIDELDHYQKAYSKARTSQAKTFIQERILETSNQLSQVEEELKDFRDRNRRIQNSPALLLEQERLVREVAVLTGVFTTLKQQFETTKIEELKDSDYLIIIDPPQPPLRKAKPRKLVAIIMTGFFGLCVSLLTLSIIYFKDNIDPKDQKNINMARLIFSKNFRKNTF